MKFDYDPEITRLVDQLSYAPHPFLVPYPFVKSIIESIVGPATDSERGVNMERLKKVAKDKGIDI